MTKLKNGKCIIFLTFSPHIKRKHIDTTGPRAVSIKEAKRDLGMP